MKTVINTQTRRVLFCIQDDVNVDLQPNEQIIDDVCDLPFDPETQVQVYHAESNTFSIQPK